MLSPRLVRLSLWMALFLAVVPAARSFADPAAPAAHAYVIHGGDQLNVEVYGDQTLTQTVTVLGDGTIDYPLVGRIAVGGKTPDQAAAIVRQRLLRFVRNPLVTVVVAQQDQPNVLVLGDVKTPGKYVLRSGARLTDAIAAAGGLSDTINGSYPTVRVSDGQGNVQTVSLQQLLRDGDLASDIGLSEGSVVYVQGPVSYDIEVTGAVDHPGEIVLHDGDRLSMAIAKAGDSANSNADLNHIRVTRTLPDGTTQVSEIDLYQALEKGDRSKDIVLQKNDLVFVPQARKGGGFLDALGLLVRALVP